MPTKLDSSSVHLRLREYQPEDLETLWHLDQRCFDEGISYSKLELRHYVELKGAFTLVAETEGTTPARICGFIVAQRRRGGYGHILTIDVDPSFRQRGIGTLLLQGAHERLAHAGCHTVFLETAVNNLAALAFYKVHQYNVVRTLPRYYHATGVDAFLMAAKLTPAPSR